jgi:hypothetical protein
MGLLLASVVLAAITVAGAGAHAESTKGGHADPLRSFVPAASIGTVRRASPSDYVGRDGVGGSELRTRFGASGLVRCGSAIGTGQLTMRADIITTAAHVLIGPDGQSRGSCTFEPTIAGDSGPVAIDLSSIRAGSTTPMSAPAIRDWAVARLVAPINGAIPYRLAASGGGLGGVTMCAGGNGRADRMGIEHCGARRMIGTSRDGIREIAIDCSAAPGASGAALLSDRHRMVAIHVGYRSTNPDKAQPFSMTHYNFAITIDGRFRRALLAATAARH